MIIFIGYSIWFCLVWFGLIDLVLFDCSSLCIDYSVWFLISIDFSFDCSSLNYLVWMFLSLMIILLIVCLFINSFVWSSSLLILWLNVVLWVWRDMLDNKQLNLCYWTFGPSLLIYVVNNIYNFDIFVQWHRSIYLGIKIVVCHGCVYEIRDFRKKLQHRM
jgi:hypothetical protein